MNPRQPRLHDPGFLAWLRQQDCICGCNQPPPCDAAHLRSGSLKYNKSPTGMGQKPDDKWALPLKHNHHMQQHSYGDELGWWLSKGIGDPFRLCQWYYAAYGGTGGQPKARKKRVTIVPKGFATKRKMPSRPFARGKRKIESRGFK